MAKQQGVMTQQTEFLFRADAYLRQCPATVLAVTGRGGIVLDRTVFYPSGGGQPGDSGALKRADGSVIEIATAVYDNPEKTIIAHVAGAGQAVPEVGEMVTAALGWDQRYLRMRMHSGLHLLSVVLAYPVTGGSIGHDESRLDFDIPDAGIDKDAVTAELNALISRDAAITERWITDAELDANPGLVKTMSVKPPRGSGRIRLVEIAGLDVQPCGGTHVRWTSEIGRMAVTQIEKKGKQNRRVRVRFG